MADTTTHVIQYIGDIKNIQQKIQELERINQITADKLGKDFSRATEIVSRTLDKVATKRIQLAGGQEAVQTLSTFTTVARTADGQLRTLTETVKRQNGALIDTSTTISRGAKVSKTFGQNLADLAKRASLTIPVWFALRQGVSSVFRVIREGIQNIAEFDRVLQKARRNLQGSTEDIATNFERLRQAVVKLSLESGVSVEKITNAFQKFATTGLDYETSIQGAIASTKLAVTTFGDTEEIANGVARAFRVLKDSTAETEDPAKLISVLFAQLDELWQDNAFEIGELTQALERFSTVARNSNFTAQQTISILASLQTAGIRGTRAGRLLSTAVIQLDKNFNEINDILGLHLDPRLQTTFERFLLVTDAIRQLNATDPTKASQAIAELFGGVRGGLPVQAIISLNKELRENLEVTGNLIQFTKSYKEQNVQINRLSEQFKNLGKETGKALVTGLVGAENFQQALQKIVAVMRVIQANAQKSGDIIKSTFVGIINPASVYIKVLDTIKNRQDKFEKETKDTFTRLAKGLRGELSKIELEQLLIEDVIGGKIELSENVRSRIENALREQLQSLSAPVSVKAEPTFDPEIANRAFQEQQQIAKLILEDELSILKARGASNKELLQQEGNLRATLGIEEDALDVLDRTLKIQTESAIERQKTGQLILENTLATLEAQGASTSELLDAETILRTQLGLHDDMIAILDRQFRKEQAISNENRQRNQLIIDAQLENLRLNGATNLQLLQQRIELERLAGINQDALSQLKNQLDVEREITKEKKGQVGLSSESVRIFQVAEKFGNQVARGVIQFLRGDISTEVLRNANFGNAFVADLDRALNEFFSSELLQRRARDFFFGDFARGATIPIAERTAVRDANLEALRSQITQPPVIDLKNLTLPEINTIIDQINVQVRADLSDREFDLKVVNSMLNAIENSNVRQRIREEIENF